MTMTDGQVDDPTHYLTLAERKAAIATIPWVARTSKNWQGRCEVLRADAPAFVRYMTAEQWQRPENDELRETWRCKNNAHWVFIGLDGRIRTLCWSHLWYAGQQESTVDLSGRQGYRQWSQHHHLRLGTGLVHVGLRMSPKS
jgi:hypothetical protein